MPLAFGFSRSRLLNRRSNHQASPVLRLWIVFSSASPSMSEPSAADTGGRPATIREGRVEIFTDEFNSVFYNKAQVNNRDISIAVLRSFISKRRKEYATRSTKGGPKDNALREDAKYKAPRVLEALAASGLRAISSASIVKSSPLKLSHVYQCTGCNSFHLQTIGRTNSKDKRNIVLPNFCPPMPEECSECGHKYVMGGPIWSNPIHDKEWAASILSNVHAMSTVYPAYTKISAILTSVSEELPDAPLFVSLHSLCATLKCTNPTMGMLYSAIRNAGYQISGSHVDPLALKTDAPISVIWDIMRCWVKLHPVKRRPGNHPGNIILSQEPKLQANFSQVPQVSVPQKSPRFVPNPEKYWGPRPKAGRHPKICHMEKILNE